MTIRRELAQRDGIHPDVSERYEDLGKRSDSAATPDVRAAREEREAIAEYLKARADEYGVRADSALQLERPRLLTAASALELATREIRDGAHRKEG